MKTFKEMNEEVSGTAAAREKLKAAKKGDELTFNHHKHGEVSGKYQGIKRMGGRAYAHVEHPKHGAFWVPPHHIQKHTPAVKESVDTVQEATASKGAWVSHNSSGRVGQVTHVSGDKSIVGVKYNNGKYVEHETERFLANHSSVKTTKEETSLDEADTVAAFDPHKPGYLLKKSSLGHTYLNVAHDSPMGKKALASGKYTTKNFKHKSGDFTHVVPK